MQTLTFTWTGRQRHVMRARSWMRFNVNRDAETHRHCCTANLSRNGQDLLSVRVHFVYTYMPYIELNCKNIYSKCVIYFDKKAVCMLQISVILYIPQFMYSEISQYNQTSRAFVNLCYDSPGGQYAGLHNDKCKSPTRLNGHISEA